MGVHSAVQVFAEVRRALAQDHQYVVEVPSEDLAYRELLHRAGQQAGYLFGWTVRTVTSKPLRRGDGTLVVAVLISRPEGAIISGLAPPEESAS